ncbi:MAG: hypothetical protein FWC15_05265, partial [Fibromonadales bacterium]|nr:hypothetical protein [Fibromonadales bacterium]
MTFFEKIIYIHIEVMFVSKYSAYYNYLGNFQEPPVEGLFYELPLNKNRCPPFIEELSQRPIREVLRKATDCEARSFLANYALFNAAKGGNAQG